MVPVSCEHTAPSSNETEVGVRSLAPPTVSFRDKDCGIDDDCLADAVASIIREVESLSKSGAFPSLESFVDIDKKRGTYLGPTMESNWVLPGRLLVGAYPASMNDSHHAHLLCTILLQGVSTFICLQQEYRSHGVTEPMWRSGEALRPYFQDVLQLLRKLQELREADPQAVPPVSAPEATTFVHFPIVDCNVADDTKVLQLAAQLAIRIAMGEVLYLHCWGGHGRTGTVVSIMLHLMYGLGAEESMRRCQHVHDVRRIPISVGSPQTEAQREQVRRVVSRLLKGSMAPTDAAVVPAPDVVPSCELAPRGVPMPAKTENSPSGPTVTHQRQPKNKGSSTKKYGGAFSAPSGSQGSAPAPVPAQDKVCCSSGSHKIGAADAAAAATTEGTEALTGQGNSGETSTPPAVIGGRRGWIRGRREAFAPAPNGVGEEVPGWVVSEETAGLCTPSKAVGVGECNVEVERGTRSVVLCPGAGDEDSTAWENHGEDRAWSAADHGTGRRLRPRTSSWQREDDADSVPALGQGPPASALQVSEAPGEGVGDCGRGTSGRARRKSFMDPPFQEEEESSSRGARSNRLRRKSAPGQSPRSAERDHSRAADASYTLATEEEVQREPALGMPVAPGADISAPTG